jgi:hypothetical protein
MSEDHSDTLAPSDARRASTISLAWSTQLVSEVRLATASFMRGEGGRQGVLNHYLDMICAKFRSFIVTFKNPRVRIIQLR